MKNAYFLNWGHKSSLRCVDLTRECGWLSSGKCGRDVSDRGGGEEKITRRVVEAASILI